MVERGTVLIGDCEDFNLLLDLRSLIYSQQSVEKGYVLALYKTIIINLKYLLHCTYLPMNVFV